MDEWIVAACSALRFFKFMQSISKKKHQTVSWACRNDKARIHCATRPLVGHITQNASNARKLITGKGFLCAEERSAGEIGPRT